MYCIAKSIIFLVSCVGWWLLFELITTTNTYVEVLKITILYKLCDVIKLSILRPINSVLTKLQQNKCKWLFGMIILHAFYVVKSITSLLLACNYYCGHIWWLGEWTILQYHNKKRTFSTLLILKWRRQQTREAITFNSTKNSKSEHHSSRQEKNKTENPATQKILHAQKSF